MRYQPDHGGKAGFDRLRVAQGGAAIFDGWKLLKMKEAGNRGFRFRG